MLHCNKSGLTAPGAVLSLAGMATNSTESKTESKSAPKAELPNPFAAFAGAMPSMPSMPSMPMQNEIASWPSWPASFSMR